MYLVGGFLDGKIHPQEHEGLNKNANRSNSSKDDENDLWCLHVSCSPVRLALLEKDLLMRRLLARDAWGVGAGGGAIGLPACFDGGLYAITLLVHKVLALAHQIIQLGLAAV